MAKKIDQSKLPDRWDGDVFEFGKRVMPELGPKIGVHWGHLLMLEKYLRDIREGSNAVLKADASARPETDHGDFTDVSLEASQILDLARWLETQVRGIRTGQWPDDEHGQSDQSPPANPSRRDLSDLFPFLRDDPDRFV